MHGQPHIRDDDDDDDDDDNNNNNNKFVHLSFLVLLPSSARTGAETLRFPPHENKIIFTAVVCISWSTSPQGLAWYVVIACKEYARQLASNVVWLGGLS